MPRHRSLAYSLAFAAALGGSITFSKSTFAEESVYEILIPADPPYYRVRYEGSSEEGRLDFPVSYTVWVPPGVETLRGLIVHQHGCGEGSCKSGQTGAFDLHWQALAKHHDCALMSPSYEQPADADCQLWCDPRNGSDAAFRQSLADLGAMADHPELATVPWALWGHSGGGHWAGGMLFLHPERVAAVWLRSGVPFLEENPDRPHIRAHELSDAALAVPVMCNLGTQEGVTEKEGRFAGVWPANEPFFRAMRGEGGLIGVAIDPLTAHECGNQRYLAIPWLDACLTARLPLENGAPLRPMPKAEAWIAPLEPGQNPPTPPLPAKSFAGAVESSVWLPNKAIAEAWSHYIRDTAVPDTTPPPAPVNVHLEGNELTWEAEADRESGLEGFLIERDGEFLAHVPEEPRNRFGRPLFQDLQYSDTPAQPLARMRFVDTTAEPGKSHRYRVIAVNTVGLRSDSK